MSVNNKRVFYVKYLSHPIYTEILKVRRAPQDRLENCANATMSPRRILVVVRTLPDRRGARRTGAALPRYCRFGRSVRRTRWGWSPAPGAGFDPVDVDACTAAGVVVVNQSGGNANSVAEHAVGMMLTLSKRIIEADRAGAAARGRSSTATR